MAVPKSEHAGVPSVYCVSLSLLLFDVLHDRGADHVLILWAASVVHVLSMRRSWFAYYLAASAKDCPASSSFGVYKQ